MAFDLEYYQRFYFNRRTAVTSKAEMRARARLIAGCVDYVGLPVAKILDAGCGVGLLRAPLLRALQARQLHRPGIQRLSVPALRLAARARSRPSAPASASIW